MENAAKFQANSQPTNVERIVERIIERDRPQPPPPPPPPAPAPAVPAGPTTINIGTYVDKVDQSQTDARTVNIGSYVDNMTDARSVNIDARSVTISEFAQVHEGAISQLAIQQGIPVEQALQLMYYLGMQPDANHGQGGRHEVDILRRPKPEEIPASSSSDQPPPPPPGACAIAIESTTSSSKPKPKNKGG